MEDVCDVVCRRGDVSILLEGVRLGGCVRRSWGLWMCSICDSKIEPHQKKPAHVKASWLDEPEPVPSLTASSAAAHLLHADKASRVSR